MAPTRRPILSDGWSLFAVVVILYAALWGFWILFHGYGYDNGDTYRILNTWQVLLSEKRYEPSRYVGYMVAEILHGYAASIGGPILSNLVTVLFMTAAFAALAAIGRFFAVGSFLPVAAALLANAVLLVGAFTTTDFMIALGLFSVGFYLMTIEEDVGGVLLMASSAGARLSYLFMAFIAVIFLLRFRQKAQGRQVSVLTYFLYLASTFFVAGMFYLPMWLQHGLLFDWFGQTRPTDQGLFGIVARWIYKPFMLVSILGVAGMAAGAVLDRTRMKPEAGADIDGALRRRWFLYLCATMIAFHAVLFLYLPNKLDYNLPALIFGAFALQALGMRFALLSLTVGELISGIVTIQPLKVSYEDIDYCEDVMASGAAISPHLEAGPLLANERDRDLNTKCGLKLLKFQPPDLYGPLPSAGR